MIAVALALALLGLSKCPPAQPPSSKAFVIAVIGDGVPSSSPPPTRNYPLNRAQGRDMWSGVKAAYEKSPRLNGVRDLVTLEPFDDGGAADEAQRLARRIQSNPNVIAVIGHATSETTRSAAWIYNEVGIPLLMPIATSPYAVYPPNSAISEDKRLPNCIRLPPSDDRVQAPAVAALAKRRISPPGKRITLLRDVSKDTPEYSGPLYDKLNKLPEIIQRQEVNAERTNFQLVATAIKDEQSDLIIFCGYGTTARRLIQALREVYAAVNVSERPRIILTDGCRIPDLDTSGFDVYLTFPVPTIKNLKPGDETDDFKILLDTINTDGYETYQLHGYDAMLMIGGALEKCRNTLSRTCVRQQLMNSQDFRGVLSMYYFIGGENTFPNYYVYHTGADEHAPLGQLSFLWEIQTNEIKTYLDKLK
jgi:ABC-type branched-subunit amino acid transport system substrate-binding protein